MVRLRIGLTVATASLRVGLSVAPGEKLRCVGLSGVALRHVAIERCRPAVVVTGPALEASSLVAQCREHSSSPRKSDDSKVHSGFS